MVATSPSEHEPTYGNLPDEQEIAIYEARFCDGCAARGVRRAIAHDELTLPLTPDAACLPCALYACGCDLLMSRQPAAILERLS